MEKIEKDGKPEPRIMYITTSKENIMKIKPQKEPDKIDIHIIGDKVNEHHVQRFDSSYDYTFKSGNTTYQIKKDCLIRKEMSFREKLQNFFHIKTIRQKFKIYFNYENAEPTDINKPEPKFNGRLGYTIVHAKIPLMGYGSLYRNEGRFNINKRTLIIIAVGVMVGIVVLYLYSQGWITRMIPH